MLTNVCENIKKARIKCGYTQNGLAKLSGVSQSTISAIESANRNPSTETVATLALFLGVTVSDLIGDNETEEQFAPNEQGRLQGSQTTPKNPNGGNDMKGLADRIIEKRKALHLSQNKLAHLAGIGQPTLSAIESDNKNPSVETLSMIAAALGTTVSELMGEDDTKGQTAPNERDSLQNEAAYLIRNLPPAEQEQAIAFLRFLSDNAKRK